MSEGETLIEICRDEHIPRESTVRGWAMDDREGFSARYARARAMGVEHEAEEIKLLAAEIKLGSERTVKRTINNTGEVTGVEESVKQSDMLAHRKLMIETRQWRVSRMGRKYWGAPAEAADPKAGPDDGTDRTIIEGGLPAEEDL